MEQDTQASLKKETGLLTKLGELDAKKSGHMSKLQASADQVVAALKVLAPTAFAAE